MSWWTVFWLVVSNSAFGIGCWTAGNLVLLFWGERRQELKRRRAGLRKQDWSPRQDPALYRNG